jgi:hypothetical protein
MMKVRLSYAAQDNFRRPRIFLVIFLVLLILGLMGASGRLKALSHRLSTPLHFLDGRVEATLWLQKRGRLSSPAVGGLRGTATGRSAYDRAACLQHQQRFPLSSDESPDIPRLSGRNMKKLTRERLFAGPKKANKIRTRLGRAKLA